LSCCAVWIIEGLGTGIHGITWINSPTTGALHIENCTINDFGSGNGVNVALGASTSLGELYMTNVISRNSPSTAAAAGAGVYLNSQAGIVRAVLNNVLLENNTKGLEATGRSRVIMSDSTASGNSSAGIRAAAAAGTEVDLTRVTVNATEPAFRPI